LIIVCDTNVLVSALVFPGGIPDKIVRSVFTRRFQHATSPDILTEFRRVLQKLKIDKKKTESLVSLIAESSQLVYPTMRLSLIKEDETDNRILECAITAKAKFLITGDKKHLQSIKTYKNITLVSPKEFSTRVGLI